MKIGFYLIAIIVLAGACKDIRNAGDTEVLASVGDKVLIRSEVKAIIPRGVSSADSLLFAENFIKRWMKDALVYDVALHNLGEDEAEVRKLVEEYRHSLVRYRYLEHLLQERLMSEIRESDRLRYYEENQQKFILDRSLIKGLFLKIPADAPGLKEVKSWYKQNSDDALEKIEKYSLQNATIYDYFYDRWVAFDAIMDKIPMNIANPDQFLEANKVVEVTDSSYCYLLNIREYLVSGTVAPYDYVASQITDVLVNQRKVTFVKDFEEDLYNDAIRNGKAKRFIGSDQ